jgi:hypothetical protein
MIRLHVGSQLNVVCTGRGGGKMETEAKNYMGRHIVVIQNSLD